MDFSLIKNRIHVSAPAVKSSAPQKDVKQEKSKSRLAVRGALFGAGVGVGDGLATVICAKQDINSAIKKFQGYTYAQKKQAVLGLRSQNITVKQYKELAQKIYNASISKTMLKRAVLYGGLAALAGFTIDLFRNKAAKKNA